MIKLNNNFEQFTEPIPLCAARVDSLRSHGHMEEALRLAVSVVRTMKQQQLVAQRKWHESQQSTSGSSSNSSLGTSTRSSSNNNCCNKGGSGSSNACKMKHSCKMGACTSRCQGHCTSNSCSTTSINAPTNTDGWVGHPLDPIGCLFDTLAEASVVPDNERSTTPSYLGEFFS